MQSSTIRIDEEVRTELQRRAEPLDDTPNSVLRRVFGLPESEGRIDPRVAKLRDLVKDLVGEPLKYRRDASGYAVLSRTEKVVAYIRPHKEKLRIAARKRDAEKAGLDWDNERQDRFFSGVSVRWHIQDDDHPAYRHVAAILVKLWNTDY